ncbi:diguanylate cyclase/phosphodiesterase (GGDEF & EAL domains) with PAS/PAC sensor(s) [hydrothermal vent metagenome]|uniref:Diguanylate cyclase/phosphodiesterase (GGDEF & EAL domains) with PAS/PAC sensor(S) n=1 Tax=hydrothermal vent metagenome TaxID=652676 RepID=A0A3B0XYK6_9ZZZZ
MYQSIQNWLLKSISRQITISLILMLSVALLLPAFIFYHTQKSALDGTVEQLARQLISSLRASISKPLMQEDNFLALQIVNTHIKNNQQQIKIDGLFKISEIAILNKKNLLFAHSAPKTHSLQKPYTGLIPKDILKSNMSKNIIVTIPENENNSLRLYTNATHLNNPYGIIILQLDLSLLNNINKKTIMQFGFFYIVTMTITLMIGLAFSEWISQPLKIIQNSLAKMGSGKLNLTSMHRRHDEYHQLSTALEKTDKALFDSYSTIDLLLDSTAEAIYGIDINGNCTFINKACIKILGYDKKSEIINKNIFQLLHNKVHEKTSKINKSTILEERIHFDNEVIWRKDNSYFFAEYWSHPIFKNHSCVGAVITFLDVTDRKMALDALKKREQYLSLMLHSIGDAVIATDEKGRITRMNPVAEKLTGWRFTEAKGEQVKNVFPIINATTRIPIENPIEKVIGNGKVVHLSNHTTLIAKDGTEHHIADSAAPILDAENKIQGMVLVFNDVTEQYFLRNQLNEEKKKLERIFDDMQSMVAILDIDGSITFINNMPLKITQLNKQDVLNVKIWDLNFINYDENIKTTVKHDCLKALAGEITFSDIKISTPDDLLWIEFSVHPVFNEAGVIIQLVAEGRDINQRKQQEEIIRRTQKMDAIGQLAGGIAHDFNNQLGVVIGYLDILKGSKINKQQNKCIESSTRATLRCIDLTRQLLAFSRKKSKEIAIIDINALLQDLKTMITRTVTPEVEVKYYLEENLWQAEIDAGEFEDAMLNIVINARDVMPHGGQLILETFNKVIDKNYADRKLNIQHGEYIHIKLSDTGSGMDKQTLEHIFEPFFTTKSEGKGTGLGLAMVYAFIKRINGSIKFYSEVEIGTTINIYIPRSTATINKKHTEENNISISTGNEKILIVDDEEDLLSLASKFLTDLGYIIKTADNAIQALEILKQDSSYNLVFSDIVMPGGMNGYELAANIMQQWPNIKILLTSGYTSRATNDNESIVTKHKILSKPYRKYEVAQRVRQILEEII